MSAPTLEEIAERVTALEQAMARVQASAEQKPRKGWESTYGVFRDDPAMQEIMELGRQIRDAEQPEDEP